MYRFGDTSFGFFSIQRPYSPGKVVVEIELQSQLSSMTENFKVQGSCSIDCEHLIFTPEEEERWIPSLGSLAGSTGTQRVGEVRVMFTCRKEVNNNNNNNNNSYYYFCLLLQLL